MAERRRRWGWIGFWVALVVLGTLRYGLPRWRAHLETLGTWEVEAGPIVATAADGRLVVATVVVQERPNWSRSTRRGYANDHVVELQLNGPDGSDAGRVPVARTRTNVLNVSLLGATRDRVWVFVEGIRVVALSRRAVDLDPAALEARFPSLAGLLSDDVRHYELADDTLVVTTRDARRVALDVDAGTLVPAAAPTAPPRARDMDEWRRQMADYDRRMAEATGPRVASLPGEFGLDAWRAGNHWLGLLSDEERTSLDASWARPRQSRFGTPARRRVWLADASTAAPDASEHGAVALRDVRPAPHPAEYLRGAVLRDGFRLRPVAIPESSDVVVEHYTAIDRSGAVRLTRLAIDGTPRWTAAVPLRFPRTVAAAGDHVVLTGLPPGVDDERRMQLVSVRLADGAVATYAYDPR